MNPEFTSLFHKISERPFWSMWGINHKHAPLNILGKFNLNESDLVKCELFFKKNNIHEYLIIPTCNRVEIYIFSDAKLPHFKYLPFFAHIEHDLLSNSDYYYSYSNHECIRHLMNVAIGLDSLILGEAQIFGQLKKGFDFSLKENKQAKSNLYALMQSTYKVTKRCRHHTNIAKGSVSIASTSVQLTKKIYDNLSNKNIAILGAGDTAELLLEHLVKENPYIDIFNRTLTNAQKLNLKIKGKGQCFTLDTIQSKLHTYDVVFSALNTKEPIINTQDYKALKTKNSFPHIQLFIDLCIPYSIDQNLSNQESNVLLYTIDDLKQVIDDNISKRKEDLPLINTYIDEEISAYYQNKRLKSKDSFIKECYEELNTILHQEVLSLLQNYNHKLSEEEIKTIFNSIQRSAKKIVHKPIKAIKNKSK